MEELATDIGQIIVSGNYYFILDKETGIFFTFCNTRRMTGRIARAARFHDYQEAKNIKDTIDTLPNGLIVSWSIVSYSEYKKERLDKLPHPNISRGPKNLKDLYILKNKKDFLFFSRANNSRITKEPATADIFLSKEDAEEVKQRYKDFVYFSIEEYIPVHRYMFVKRTLVNMYSKTLSPRNFTVQDKTKKVFLSFSNVTRQTCTLSKAAFFSSTKEAVEAALLAGWKVENFKIVDRCTELDFPEKATHSKSKAIEPSKVFVICNPPYTQDGTYTFFGRMSQTLVTKVARNSDLFLTREAAQKTLDYYRDEMMLGSSNSPLSESARIISLEDALQLESPSNIRRGGTPKNSEEFILQDKDNNAFITFSTPSRRTNSRERASVFLSTEEKDRTIELLSENGIEAISIPIQEVSKYIKNIDTSHRFTWSYKRTDWWVIFFQEENSIRFFSRSKKGRFCTFSYEADIFQSKDDAQMEIDFYKLQNAKVEKLGSVFQSQ